MGISFKYKLFFNFKYMWNKFESVYRVLLGFMLIDNKIDEKEKKYIIDFLDTKFGKNITQSSQSLAYQKDKLGFENFRADALTIYESFSREEQYEIIDFISNMIKSDWDVNEKEVMLFEILLESWKIDKAIMTTLWIKKSLWSKFFG